MIELEETLAPLCNVINYCYEELYPNLNKYPRFSLTRAMITLWKTKVFGKIQSNLYDSFGEILCTERCENAKFGKEQTEKLKKVSKENSKSFDIEKMERMLSNELSGIFESKSEIDIGMPSIRSNDLLFK